jgi:hypothetical protein
VGPPWEARVARAARAVGPPVMICAVSWLSRLSVRARAALILGVVLFLLISGVLARFLSVENVEREGVLTLLQAQAAGNERAMLDDQSGCRRRVACVATTRANISHLRRRGSVKILTLTSATAYSLSGSTGATRVAWTVIGELPLVQCVQVKRTGNFLTGVSLRVLSVSAPIPNSSDC